MTGLNSEQSEALDACMDNSNHVVTIQGPPGTGKTKTLTRLVDAILLCTVLNICGRYFTMYPLLNITDMTLFYYVQY